MPKNQSQSARDRRKTILTPGEAAEILDVSPVTVSRLLDSNLLKGFKVPGSKVRRVTVDSVKEMIKATGRSNERFDWWMKCNANGS